MANTMHNKYEIIKNLGIAIKQGLVAFGVTKKNAQQQDVSLFDVIEYGQPKMWQMDKVVCLNYIRHSRVGWQGRSYPVVGAVGDRTLTRKNDWVEQQEWQIHVIMKRGSADNPTVATVTTEDVLSMIVAWMNDRGNTKLRENGISNLPIDPASVMLYNDDSDLYQKRAVINMTLIVPKEFSFGQDEIAAGAVETYPI